MCKIPIILWIANAAAPARSAAVKVARSMDRSCSAPDCSRNIILSGTSTILPETSHHAPRNSAWG